MKRESFKVTQEGKFVGIAHKWNSAKRLAEEDIRRNGKGISKRYTLDSHSISKNEYGEHVEGVLTWKGDKGDLQSYRIEKQ